MPIKSWVISLPPQKIYKGIRYGYPSSDTNGGKQEVISSVYAENQPLAIVISHLY
jgi:hypothetical protein